MLDGSGPDLDLQRSAKARVDYLACCQVAVMLPEEPQDPKATGC